MPTSLTKKGAWYNRSLFAVLLTFSLTFLSNAVFAQRQESLLSSSRLKKMSLEELMNTEVISVSMRPEKLAEVASAVQVITGEDIHRSGVTRLPGALRLVSNLQMEQANSHDWAITARGFNGLPSAGGVLANKLLVMIDGRSIYSPLFGGVYWDVQNTLLQDLDHIEVVSGPGGTLWGANAVNGVINIITKSARETQGWYLSGAAGSFLQDLGEVRYGTRVDSTLFVRIYGQRLDQRNTELAGGINAKDAWNMTQGGFRMDYYPSATNTFTLQGDLYSGVANKDSLLKHTVTNGQNVLARFTHLFSGSSDLKIQAYFDRTWRTTPHSATPFSYRINTYDIDIQHRFAAGKLHNIVYGIGYRLQEDEAAASLLPLSRNMPLYSGFVQDEITFVPNFLKLTIGSKFLHNIYSGFETQPGARITWTVDRRQTIWTAVSRAVRTPTRFDTDFIRRRLKFLSEKVIAYELGYRVRPLDRLSLSLASFYNRYHDIRSIDSNASPTVPLVLANSQRAESWGFELSGSFQALEWWRLRGGYTYFSKNIWPTSPKVLPASVDFEGVDPRHQCLLQSIMDLPRHLQLDLVARYADQLPGSTFTAHIPAYFTFDLRLAWQYKRFEISLVGQNLTKDQHKETGSSQIPRSIYGRVICQL
ncbi:TonB-dependent receptor [Flavitalea sp. BT771]|uniref:TonB-dependent receptor plug domain-containing protein n=1 Tax=Flavitalea sp. BT771 TaxID=3063329 RepID=UPI0026E16E42|nr:TonB-dependent receptor plug domain-containing protein [Flavitalea sp. BT771]MDO6432728.1 TonB-dependent receptor [Flavitalea sp. BT771]MDV6221996.1 TonB-dependent receptor [Flavitalea sp. BT771]